MCAKHKQSKKVKNAGINKKGIPTCYTTHYSIIRIQEEA